MKKRMDNNDIMLIKLAAKGASRGTEELIEIIIYLLNLHYRVLYNTKTVAQHHGIDQMNNTLCEADNLCGLMDDESPNELFDSKEWRDEICSI